MFYYLYIQKPCQTCIIFIINKIRFSASGKQRANLHEKRAKSHT